MKKKGQKFGHFLDIASLVFANFAYDRQVWPLTGHGGQVVEEHTLALKPLFSRQKL